MRYPNPREGIFAQELDAWIIALIAITSIVGIVVVCLIILRYLEYRKKEKTGVKAKSTTSLKRSTSQTEKTASLPQSSRSNVSVGSNL
ncbi:membrane cofactor protein isoform X4 [Peromyscus leucopus]|nr:membrane cofactor protein isoform X4 [Peromyscus leucopus]